MVKKIKVGSPAWVKKMQRARKAAAKKRKGVGKSLKHVGMVDRINGKKFKQSEIEKRIARLEQLIGETQQGRDTTNPRETRTLGLQGMTEERDRLNREIEKLENETR
jgi:hypothetical protein